MTLSASTHGREPGITAPLRAALLACALAATSSLLHAQQLAANPVNELKQLSIEQLTHIVVTSVTRSPQPLSRAAAAVADERSAIERAVFGRLTWDM
jgi:outer membrane cobalamin receptor